MHDPILERTLRQVRTEKARDRKRRGGVVTAVSTALAAAVLAGGVYLGQHSVSGERVLVATAATGVRMTATLTPADGWVRLRAVVDGIDAGEKCQLVVTDLRGRRYVAGGWVASRLGDGDTALAGAAMVDLDELAALSVVTVDGRVLVTATPHDSTRTP
ncbi:hypothetical protein ALI22I_16670 [Saccharothrix sp. ALI-22-I]|uniref:hypothetical protein n=1 Tax=Saccharothrix sp. ALI-22-I TaxID=1933778 RepID=UPI00097BC832|nr:hypothetical protein [Saccharothrix sp. ALI-22-I]ONI89144.1 hypothetical protein ALI22I_16670 [Saccharothrix sp. ALI-22-I]